MRPVLRWFGSKTYMVKHILPLLPQHYCYVEVFGGGASLLLNKPLSSVEVYNDIDSSVVDFFRVFQDCVQYERFKHKCMYTPYSKELYLEYLQTWKSESDLVERVHKWFVIVRMSFNGFIGKKGYAMSWQRNFANPFRICVDDMEQLVDRFRCIQIENSSWQIVLDKYDSEQTLFYLDPPYIPSVRKDKTVYQYEMSQHDHQNMIDRLNHIKGKVMLSGYPNQLYDGLSWDRKDFATTCFSGHHGKTNSNRTECLWMNYNPPQLQLF